MRHLDDGLLHSWLDRDRSDLSPDGLPAIEQHLRACPECAARVHAAEALRARARSILERAAPRFEPPDFSTIRARAAAPRASLGPPRAPRWAAMGWAASVVLALGIGWLGRGLVMGPRSSPSLPVASAPVQAASGAPLPQETSPASGGGSATTESVATGAASDSRPVPTVAQTPPPPISAGTPSALTPPAPSLTGSGRRVEIGRVAEIGPVVERARELSVRGRVLAESGSPVAAAVVSVSGTSIAVLTGPDGSFAIRVPNPVQPDSLTLVATRIGYQAARLDLPAEPDGTVSADILLQSQALQLDAIVATGLVDPVSARQSPVSVATASGAFDRAAAPLAPVGPGRTDVDRVAAERRFGRPILTLPGSPILSMTVADEGGVPVARVTQQVGDAPVVLVQRRVTPGGAVASASRDSDEATVVVEDVLVTGTGPMPLDSIRALLETLR